ncbi:2Fe-2S iron-sulfur cluster-binding protein [Shewanella sp. GD03713]|uniref:2Fe-2S iron-sulfur cluster-binding protein n=1 Tax=Shewanella sp. GD03713 TaxID=2975372 RepID=UPI0024498D82|nr:2Fe-2S iron-sulfur cluster-binding protein [Shewanella sp. GD03713]MDH1472785.1 2Fe-2S iron-sulfur cluster-binding protein [Shewanella sp. GD03713]
MLISIESDNNSTLLLQLEVKGISVFTECRSGYCWACSTRLVKGVVSYQSKPLSVKDGHVLVCCAIAHTDVTLEV